MGPARPVNDYLFWIYPYLYRTSGMFYSDLILANDAATAAKKTAFEAAQAADKALSEASDAEANAYSQLAQAVALAGPDGVVDASPAGVRVFESDGKTVTVRRPLDKGASVPTPAPTPTPAPAG